MFTYRRRRHYAERLAATLADARATPLIHALDLAEPGSIAALVHALQGSRLKIDGMVIAAAGGLERNEPADYAERLNAAGPWRLISALQPVLARGGRIVLVTSHEAHFFGKRPTYQPYAEIARTKHAGAARILAEQQSLEHQGLSFHIVSADLIEDTPTAKLLEFGDPGLLERRRSASGGLPTTEEVATAIVDILQGEARQFGEAVYVGSFERLD